MKTEKKLKTIIMVLALMASSTNLFAITKGNTSTDNTNPGDDYVEYTHNHNGTGDNHVLVAMVAINNNNNWSGWPTYNGVSPDHTAINVNMSGALTFKVLVMAWDNPATGDNTFRINFSANEWNATSSICQSFSEATVGNYATNGGTDNANSQTLSVTTGSMVFVGCVVESNTVADITIDGTEYTSLDLNQGSDGRDIAAHTSAAIASGGTITIETDANNSTSAISNHRMEILDDSGGGGGSRRVIIIGDEQKGPEKKPEESPSKIIAVLPETSTSFRKKS